MNSVIASEALRAKQSPRINHFMRGIAFRYNRNRSEIPSRMAKHFLAMTGIFLACCFTAYAGGFQANLQGIKQNGMAQTGVGLSQDAASTFFNPGALGFLKRPVNINAGVNIAIGRIGYQEPSPGFYTTA